MKKRSELDPHHHRWRVHHVEYQSHSSAKRELTTSPSPTSPLAVLAPPTMTSIVGAATHRYPEWRVSPQVCPICPELKLGALGALAAWLPRAYSGRELSPFYSLPSEGNRLFSWNSFGLFTPCLSNGRLITVLHCPLDRCEDVQKT